MLFAWKILFLFDGVISGHCGELVVELSICILQGMSLNHLGQPMCKYVTHANSDYLDSNSCRPIYCINI